MKQNVDLFTPIHKAIRALLYDMGRQLQIADFGDQQDMAQTLDKLGHIFELLGEHARHEDLFIFSEIEKAAPGSTQESIEQHQQYEEKVEQLRNQIGRIRKMKSAKERTKQSGALNRDFTDFMAFYLMHMNHEEETALPASLEKLSDKELADIRVKVQLDTKPDRYTEWLYWMLPALNISELTLLYQQVKLSAPPAVYEKFVDIGQDCVDERRWSQLRQLVEIV